MKKQSVVCEKCGKTFDKVLKEINRSLKLGRKQFCSLSCAKLENLQILCPNCHTMTDNYRGKNIGKVKIIAGVSDTTTTCILET